MKYKVGDRVKIKSNDFFNNNKGKLSFYVDSMALCFANEIVTIKSYGRYPNTYRIDEDEGDFLWTDEMIEGLVEEETKPNTIEEAKTYWDSIKDAWICPQGYQFVDENGNVINAKKIVLEKKKKMYPKTYEECVILLGLGVLNELKHCNLSYIYKKDLIVSYQKLLICRDAYWKIAGEEMELGIPWKPDLGDEDKTKWVIFNLQNKIKLATRDIVNAILAFPTEEMRDAFYENFKELIEQCKELL